MLNQIQIEITSPILLELFGNPDGNRPLNSEHLIEFSKYVAGLDSFPSNTQFIIKDVISDKNPITNKPYIEFRIQSNKYFDINGWLRNKNKIFPNQENKLIIDNLLGDVST